MAIGKSDDEYISLTYKGNEYYVPLHFIMNEHPGGPGYILEYANTDMTNAFIDIGHSQDAKDMLEEWIVDNKNDNDDDNKENKVNKNKNSVMNDENKSKSSKMFTSTCTKWKKHTAQLIMLTLGAITTTAIVAFAVNRIHQSA